MKKNVLILLAIWIAWPVMAQEQEQEYYHHPQEIRTIFGDHPGNGGYGAISLGYTQVDGRNGVMMGGRGVWIIGHGLGMGLGGYGFVNDPEFNVTDNLYYSLAGGYGGFIFEPILLGRWPVHVSLPVLLGAGGVALTSYSEDIYNQLEPYDTYFEESSAFLVAEPGVELEMNLVRFIRLSFFGSYRFTTDLVMQNTNPRALKGWSTGVTIKIGSF